MLQILTLLGTSLPLVKTAPKVRGCGTFELRNKLATG